MCATWGGDGLRELGRMGRLGQAQAFAAVRSGVGAGWPQGPGGAGVFDGGEGAWAEAEASVVEGRGEGAGRASLFAGRGAAMPATWPPPSPPSPPSMVRGGVSGGWEISAGRAAAEGPGTGAGAGQAPEGLGGACCAATGPGGAVLPWLPVASPGFPAPAWPMAEVGPASGGSAGRRRRSASSGKARPRVGSPSSHSRSLRTPCSRAVGPWGRGRARPLQASRALRPRGESIPKARASGRLAIAAISFCVTKLMGRALCAGGGWWGDRPGVVAAGAVGAARQGGVAGPEWSPAV